jgi:hypothetical protein
VAFFRSVVPALAHGSAYYANQSLAGFMQRLFSRNPYTDPWIDIPWLAAIILGLALCAVAWWWWTTVQKPPLMRAGAFLPLLPLLSSVTWPHHLVILLPLIWLSLTALAERNWPIPTTALLLALLLFTDVVVRWPVGPAFNQPAFRIAQTVDPLVFLIANVLFFANLGFCLAGSWLLRSR